MNQIKIESHPLKPFLPKNAEILLLGSFPPPKTRWKMDFYYPNYQNDMWRIFGYLFFRDRNYFIDIANKNFYEAKIKAFLVEQEIAIFDTATEVKRLTGNASDKFLEIVTPTDLKWLLKQIPECHSIVTTGDKATDTLMLSLPEQTQKPKIGQSVTSEFLGRSFDLYRMPSSSRAYPLVLEKKAEYYQELFKKIGAL